MFESKSYTYAKIFRMIRTEVESYREVPDDIILLACNTELQYLYAQVIKKQVMTEGYISDAAAGKARLVTLKDGATALNIPYEDIERVSVGGEILMPTTARSAGAYENTYFENADGSISVVLNKDYDGACEVYYNYRPAEIDSVTSEDKVQLPTEYVAMLMDAIRAECYKYINEDSLAAKWTNDYNAYRDGFDKWIESTRPQFG